MIFLLATIQLGARQRFIGMQIIFSHYFHVYLSDSPHLAPTGGISKFEFYCNSGSGTAGAINPSNVLVDDLSPCDGQTHAEEECAMGLYRPKVWSRFAGRDPFYKPDRPLTWVGPHFQGRRNYAVTDLLLCCVSTIIISTPIYNTPNRKEMIACIHESCLEFINIEYAYIAIGM